MEILKDEEFEKWFNGKETRDTLQLIEDDLRPALGFMKAIAAYAWQSSLELLRTEHCTDCKMNRKLSPCRPAVGCIKNKDEQKKFSSCPNCGGEVLLDTLPGYYCSDRTACGWSGKLL